MTAENLQEYIEQLELERREFIERLAERDALLREAIPMIAFYPIPVVANELRDRIEKAVEA